MKQVIQLPLKNVKKEHVLDFPYWENVKLCDKESRFDFFCSLIHRKTI